MTPRDFANFSCVSTRTLRISCSVISSAISKVARASIFLRRDTSNYKHTSQPGARSSRRQAKSRTPDCKDQARRHYGQTVAQQLGTNYRSLMYWLRGDRAIPAELLPQICVLLKNFEPLDLLESQAGRVAFKIPDPKQTSSKEFQVISDLMKDVGAALESIANTLADGVVEENELNATIPKLETVIQECASVRYLLETLCKNRKKKTKK